MSLTEAKEHLKKYNLDKEIITFNTSSATVHLAGESLGVDDGLIAKSLAFIVDELPILIVCSGDVKIDNSKYRNEFHTKAKMIDKDNVESLIGHPVGGVCPFGVNKGVKIYLDNSLKKYEYVYPACGQINNAIKIKVNDLEKVVNYTKWVDVTKNINVN